MRRIMPCMPWERKLPQKVSLTWYATHLARRWNTPVCVGGGLACQVSVFRRYIVGAESDFSTSSLTSAFPVCRFQVVLRGAKGSLKGVKCLGVKYNSNRKLTSWQGGGWAWWGRKCRNVPERVWFERISIVLELPISSLLMNPGSTAEILRRVRNEIM